MPGKIIHLTTRQELKEFTNQSSAFIIDFTAEWCNPCKRIKPLVDMYFEKVRMYFDLVIVDADKGSDICSFLKVKGFPTLVSFVNKEMVESVIGTKEEDLKHFFVQSYRRVVT